MTLEQHFLPQDELTLENIIKGFTEWTLLSCNSLSYVSEQNKKLEEKNTVLEEKVVGLEQTKQELEANQKELEKEFRVWDGKCWLPLGCY
jgi:hypothetical protein